MRTEPLILSQDSFPQQGLFLGQRMAIYFDGDIRKEYSATCIRHDAERPGEMILLLDDGRVVRAEECQYNLSASKTSVMNGVSLDWRPFQPKGQR